MANSTLCTTPACLHYSSNFLASLAPSQLNIDPCTDFEQFVCYGAKTTMAEDKSTLAVSSEQTMRVLRNIIESDFRPVSNNTAPLVTRGKSTDEYLFEALQMDYQSCMNETAIAAQGIAPLGAVVDELRIKFPLTRPGSNATMGDTSLGDAVLYLSQLGINAFAEVGAANDILDPVNGRVQVLLGPSASGQEAPAEEERGAVKSLRAASYAQVLQALLPGNMTGQQSARLGTGVTDLEDAIAGITPKLNLEDLSSVASRLSLDEVAKLSPGLGYDRVIKALAPAPDAVGNVTVVHPGFLGNLSEMVSTAPKDIVQAYLVVKVVGSFLQDVKLPTLEPLKQLAEAPNSPPTPPRWQQCVGRVKMTWVLSRHFVAATLPQASKKAGEEMMEALREHFIQSVDSVPWVSADDKEKVVAKARNMTDVVGYQSSSPNNDDAEDIAAYYSGLNITADYFANVLSFRTWNTQRQFGQVGKPIDRKSFGDSPGYSVNAQNELTTNVVSIFAGIMQLPVYSADVPAYLQFGSLGSVMGHELIHGFDDHGRQFSHNGKQEVWWDNKTTAGFEERAACFVDQYSNFTLPTPDGQRPVNGSLTLGENIADAGGLRLAFDTWKSRRSPDEGKLPGLERFTPEQMFYMSHALTFCSSRREKGNARALADVHSPDAVRIKGSSANSRGFKEAFDCPVKEPVCEMW